MCKIIKYRFACHHGFRLRQSKCGGTKHKSTRKGPVPACRSEAYLSLVIPVDCGPCQHLAFEERWKRKISLAESFLVKLKERAFPGVQEVAALIGELTLEFDTATWNTRTLFPHVHKDCIVRLSVGYHERRASPLRGEVLPEEIPEPSEVVDFNHPDYEYDWDYVASTDPLHPVDITYAHPLDDVDPSWMLNHLSLEEFEQTGNGLCFDMVEAEALWTSSPGLENTSTVWDTNDEAWTEEEPNAKPMQYGLGHHAPAPRNRSASQHIQTDAIMRKSQVEADRTEMVVQEFWKLLSSEDNRDGPGSQSSSLWPDNALDTLSSLHISDESTAKANSPTALSTPPPSPPSLSSDGMSDSHSSTVMSSTDHIPQKLLSVSLQTHPSATTCPRHTPRHAHTPISNATRALYDQRRRQISKVKSIDKARFCRDWLYLSRCEIQDIEGPNGRFVQEPQSR